MLQKEQKKRKKSQFVFIISFSFVFLYFSVFIVDAQVVGETFQVINLAERARDFFIEATKGNVIGQTTLNKFGENLEVGVTTEDIQSQGGTLVFLQVAELITFSSSDGADTAAGANARSIEVEGLDGDFVAISEIVNLLGGTEVNTTQEFIRVNRLKVHETGTYSVSNAGIITGIAAISGTTQIEIPLGEGQSQTTHFTVPAGQNIIITRVAATVNTGKEVDIKLRVRENADDVTVPFSSVRTLRNVRGISVPVSGTLRGNLKFEEKTDIWAVGATSAGTTSKIEVNYDLVQYAIGS